MSVLTRISQENKLHYRRLVCCGRELPRNSWSEGMWTARCRERGTRAPCLFWQVTFPASPVFGSLEDFCPLGFLFCFVLFGGGTLVSYILFTKLSSSKSKTPFSASPLPLCNMEVLPTPRSVIGPLKSLFIKGRFSYNWQDLRRDVYKILAMAAGPEW